MGIFSKAVKPVGDVIDKIGGAIDRISTSKEEKLKAVNEISRILQDHSTERHRIDMQSDSWLSKNIRPLMLITLFLAYSVFSIIDGNIAGFEVKESYIKLLGDWGQMAFMFYFVSRGSEKIASYMFEKKHKSS